jgi:phage gp37-like protein
MDNDTWVTLEDAVLKALQAQLGSHVNTLESYQGDWRPGLRQETWRLPAVLVRLRQSRGEQVSARSYDLTLDFSLLVIVRQLRGDNAARRQEDGVYQILAGIRQALWHQDLGLAVQPLALVREEPVLNTREFSVYEALYRTVAVQDF